MLAQLRQEHPRITEAGAVTVGVFQGPPANVGEWCRDRDVPFECMSDPGHEAYRAFGLARAGVTTWLSPATVVKGIRLFRHGLTTGLPHAGQDVRQLPGTFVIERGGRIRLAHYNRDPADNASIDLILGSLGAA
jgi:peroxiredoxin